MHPKCFAPRTAHGLIGFLERLGGGYLHFSQCFYWQDYELHFVIDFVNLQG